MKETVGEVDTNFGYSSEKLTQYFNATFPSTWSSFNGLHVDGISAEQVLSKVTEILLSFESYKEIVKLKYKGFFNAEELSFLFQYFNGSIMEYKWLHVFRAYYDFIDDFKSNGEDSFSSDVAEQNEFIKKILSMYPFEFYVLQLMIIEYWNHLPSPYNHNSLLSNLMGDSPNDEE